MIEVQVFFFFLGAGNDQNARAGSEEGSGEVWSVDMKERGGEGEMGRGATGNQGETGRGQWGGAMGRGGRETGRGRRGRGDREEDDGEGGNRVGEMRRGATGWGRWGGGAMGREGKDGGKHTECLGEMRLQFFLTLFTCATPGTPASIL